MVIHLPKLYRIRKRVTRALTAPKIKVGFVVAGVQKGGTTALHNYLKRHSEIGLPRRKEAHFFDEDQHFRGLRGDAGYYHSMFEPRAGQRLFGDATPNYIYSDTAVPRMWHYNPAMKIVVLFRNPIDRAFSAWNMQRDRKAEPLEFWDAVQQEPARARALLPRQDRLSGYVDRGFYSSQLRRLWRYFPPEQTRVYKTEDLMARPAEVLGEICSFLGVAPLGTPPAEVVRDYAYVSTIDDRSRDYLRQLYEYDVRQLERMLGWDCGDWLT